MFNGKVLVAEDDMVNQLVIKTLLLKRGLEVDIVDNGEKVVQKLKEEKYDLLFMDLQMPVMDGLEATKIIRKFNKDIPIIALSAAVLEEEIIKTEEVGMDYHMSKPIEKDILDKVLNKYLN